MNDDVTAKLAPDGSHTAYVRVRYAETDQMSVVYHAAYLGYFEVARTDFLRAFGLPYVAIEAGGINLAVVDMRARMRAPARYDDVLAIRCTVAEVGPARMRLMYRVYRDAERTASHDAHALVRGEPGAEIGELLTTGETTLAAVSRETGRATRLPKELRALLERAAAAAAAAAA